MPIATDGVRGADESNVHGYFELEAVKRLHEGGGTGDTSWLNAARGSAVKIVSFLLTWLPETHDYRVIFMRRDLDEIVASQQTMLARGGDRDEAADAVRLRATYSQHLEEVGRFLAKRACFTVLDVDYSQVLEQPRAEAERIRTFTGFPLDLDAMERAVDRDQYRSRRDVRPSER